MRVGLLEDDVAIQEMLLLVLQDEGYAVVTYADAENCLEALGVRSQGEVPIPVDLMIVDWRLNGSVSGTEVIRQIRSVPRLDTLPIILTTAATFTDTDELRNLQVTLLEKPFALDDITTLIREMTHSHS
ncbi:MAG TPA: response regulator [Ktedonobacteraceae bacterium]|nr:response regulator [Ktedonobacteraceae bacterium]